MIANPGNKNVINDVNLEGASSDDKMLLFGDGMVIYLIQFYPVIM